MNTRVYVISTGEYSDYCIHAILTGPADFPFEAQCQEYEAAYERLRKQAEVEIRYTSHSGKRPWVDVYKQRQARIAELVLAEFGCKCESELGSGTFGDVLVQMLLEKHGFEMHTYDEHNAGY